MHARTALTVIAAAILFMRPACVSADSSAHALEEGVVIVPPAWAGVWDVYEETTSDCATGSVTTRSYRDTLCAGETMPVFSYPPNSAQPTYCSGPGFTDTGLALDCSNYFDCHSCCPFGTWDYQANWVANWSLSGDVATTSVTFTSHIIATAPCASSSSCSKTTGTRTRVWPESSICGAVPVRRQTWGRLKLLYR